MMTTNEYLATPETVLPAELAFGVLRVAEAPIVRHQRVVRDLTILLTAFTQEHGLGEVLPAPTDVVLDREQHLVVQPDVLFVAAERRQIVGDHIEGPPDLVVEVLSPRPRVGTIEEKVTWYARYGVRECWLFDLARRQLTVLRCADGRVVDRVPYGAAQFITSAVFPDLSLRPSEVLGWW
jgi:Uma2 family endonuclease